jgi:hypothetical protein
VNKIITILAFVFLYLGQASAQGGKLLALKDRGVIVHSYTSGSYINFEFSNHQWVAGYIDWVKADSIQVNQFALQQVMTSYGTWGEDTLKLGHLTLHINEIIAFAHERGHYTSVFSNGGLLKVAGPLYAGLNITNSLLRKDPVFSNRNLPQIASGIVAWFLGRWQSKANPNYRPIGKRYTVEVI